MTAAEPESRSRLAAAWPLFGLEIRSARLTLRLPTDEELLELMAAARDGDAIHPRDEMPFAVPWSIQPSPAFERGYLAYHWGNRASWSPESWELGVGASFEGRLIGMQGMHARSFATTRTVHTGSWIARAYQGRGLGKEMRAAILGFAFDGLGALVAETEAFLDNAASSSVSRALGYEENGRGGLAPQGELRETQRFRMTVEGWRARPRPPITIEGLDACRELFGA